MKKWFVGVAIGIILAATAYGADQLVTYQNFEGSKKQCYEKIKRADNIITADFRADTAASILQTIAADIRSSQSINSVSVQLAVDSLQAFNQAHAGNTTILNALGGLDANPFASYIQVNIGAAQDEGPIVNYFREEAQKYNVTITSILQTNQVSRQETLDTFSQLSQDTPNVKNILQNCINSTSTLFLMQEPP